MKYFVVWTVSSPYPALIAELRCLAYSLCTPCKKTRLTITMGLNPKAFLISQVLNSAFASVDS